mmetsp:Transcript_5756/g.20459  ORF Transcript_5756/g.20459 Transcript_5756/m.20459 type:complete len:259 (+) Transcript_5756:1303-2079(+)
MVLLERIRQDDLQLDLRVVVAVERRAVRRVHKVLFQLWLEAALEVVGTHRRRDGVGEDGELQPPRLRLQKQPRGQLRGIREQKGDGAPELGVLVVVVVLLWGGGADGDVLDHSRGLERAHQRFRTIRGALQRRRVDGALRRRGRLQHRDLEQEVTVGGFEARSGRGRDEFVKGAEGAVNLERDALLVVERRRRRPVAARLEHGRVLNARRVDGRVDGVCDGGPVDRLWVVQVRVSSRGKSLGDAVCPGDRAEVEARAV